MKNVAIGLSVTLRSRSVGHGLFTDEIDYVRDGGAVPEYQVISQTDREGRTVRTLTGPSCGTSHKRFVCLDKSLLFCDGHRCTIRIGKETGRIVAKA